MPFKKQSLHKKYGLSKAQGNRLKHMVEVQNELNQAGADLMFEHFTTFFCEDENEEKNINTIQRLLMERSVRSQGHSFELDSTPDLKRELIALFLDSLKPTLEGYLDSIIRNYDEAQKAFD